MAKESYVILAAKESRGCAHLWIRYLNKMMDSDEAGYLKMLNDFYLQKNENLDYFQRIIIRLILNDEGWLEYVKRQSKKPDLSWIREKYGL